MLIHINYKSNEMVMSCIGKKNEEYQSQLKGILREFLVENKHTHLPCLCGNENCRFGLQNIEDKKGKSIKGVVCKIEYDADLLMAGTELSKNYLQHLISEDKQTKALELMLVVAQIKQLSDAKNTIILLQGRNKNLTNIEKGDIEDVGKNRNKLRMDILDGLDVLFPSHS